MSKCQKTIFCPACGERCTSTSLGAYSAEILARCPHGHGWAVLLDFHADTLDNTSIISFQCDGTPAYELPDNQPSAP
jgi:hypothetical protein